MSSGNTTADALATKVLNHIDANNVGAAEVALEPALRKFPTDHGLLAAEALLLLRKGSTTEAARRAKQLAAQLPTSGAALSALVHTLQQLFLYDELVEVYQHALARVMPNDRNSMENLFMTFVRKADFPGAQRAALALQKTFPEPRYQLWIAMACVAQVPPGVADHLQLKLATRLLQAIGSGSGGHTLPSASMLYRLLMQQLQFEDARAFVCGSDGAKLGTVTERLEALRQCLVAQGRVGDASAVAALLWRREPDCWNHVERLLEALEALDTAGRGDVPESFPLPFPITESAGSAAVDAGTPLPVIATFAAMSALCNDLQETERRRRPDKMSRGPFMAALELAHRRSRVAAAAAAAPVAATDNLVVHYAKSFAHKPVAFLDCSKYLTPSAAAGITTWAAAEADSGDQLDRHRRRILALRCRVAAASQVTLQEEALQLIQDCRASYEAAKGLSTELAWSEEGHVDGYLLVAANVAVRQLAATDDDQWALVGMWCARCGVDRRLNNPALLMLSVLLGARVGLLDRAALEQLDFKSVQLDSMAHVGFAPLLATGAVGDAAAWCDRAFKYFGGLRRETTLLRAKVFTHCSVAKLAEVAAFESAGMHSIARLEAIAHHAIAGLGACQTHKERLAHLTDIAERLVEVRTLASSANGEPAVCRNEDDVVIRSLVIGIPDSAAAAACSGVLIPPAAVAVAERLKAVRMLVAIAAIAHDIAALAERRNTAAASAGSRGGKKGAARGGAAAGAPPPPPPLPLLLGSPQERAAATEALAPAALVRPTLRDIYAALIALIGREDDAATSAAGTGDRNAAANRVIALFEASAAELGAAPAAEFLHPHATALVHMLALVDCRMLPAARCGTALATALTETKRRLHAASPVLPPRAASALERATQRLSALAMDGLCEGMEKDSAAVVQQQQRVIADLLLECTAIARRR